MDIEKINAIKPEGFDESQWTELANKFNEVHEAEVFALKANSQKLKEEKTDAVNKYRNADALNQENAAKIASLEEQLKNGDSSAQKVFEEKTKELEKQYQGMISERDTQIKSLTEQNANLELFRHERNCIEEFDVAVKDKNLDPQSLTFVRDFILGKNGENFVPTRISDTQSVLATKDGKTVEAKVNDFLASETGKKFILSGNFGGGAVGSRSAGNGATITRAEFEALPPMEKAAAAQKYRII